MELTDEQKLELKKIYTGLKGSKEKESKKLFLTLFETLDFLNIDDNSYIETGLISDSYDYKNKAWIKKVYSVKVRKVTDLPVTVLCYLITKDDEYLSLGGYRKIKYDKLKYVYIKEYAYCISRFIHYNVDFNKLIINDDKYN